MKSFYKVAKKRMINDVFQSIVYKYLQGNTKEICILESFFERRLSRIIGSNRDHVVNTENMRFLELTTQL